jgi:hypothetical protein
MSHFGKSCGRPLPQKIARSKKTVVFTLHALRKDGPTRKDMLGKFVFIFGSHDLRRQKMIQNKTFNKKRKVHMCEFFAKPIFALYMGLWAPCRNAKIFSWLYCSSFISPTKAMILYNLSWTEWVELKMSWTENVWYFWQRFINLTKIHKISKFLSYPNVKFGVGIFLSSNLIKNLISHLSLSNYLWV